MITEDADAYDSILRSIEDLYIPHSRFRKVLNKVLHCLAFKMRGVAMFSLQIGGPSGVGKSAIVVKIEQAYPRVADGRQIVLKDGRTATCDHIPVLNVKMPIAPTKDLLIRAMLREIGDPFCLEGKTVQAEHRLLGYLRDGGTRAITVDEAQRAADRRGKVMQQHIGMFLQELHDRGLLVIIIGLGRSSALLNQDTMIVRRWANELRLDPYEWGTPTPPGKLPPSDYSPPSDRYEFIGILRAVIAQVSLEWHPVFDFEDESVVFLFYYASRGVIGLVKKIIHGAVYVASEDGVRVITMNILDRAWEEFFMSEPENSGMQRPFRQGFVYILPPPLPDDRAQIYPPKKPKGKNGSKQPSKAMRNAMLTDALTK